MKKVICGAALLLAAACGGTSSGFSATYSGTLTENYSCSTLGTSPTYVLPSDTFHLVVDGSGNATITLASCPGDVVYGVESQDGTVINITASNTFNCAQTDNNDDIQITNISGTLVFDQGGIDVNLNEQAIIDNDTCVGSATGAFN